MAESDRIVPLLGPVGGICQSINRTVFYIMPVYGGQSKIPRQGLNEVYCEYRGGEIMSSHHRYYPCDEDTFYRTKGWGYAIHRD
jgi:hypothetical protein